MFTVIRETLVPLISLFIFVLGNGFFSTLLAYNMTLNGEPEFFIGAMTGVMYSGLVIGSFRIEKFITRVGHIRAFSTFSASIAVISLLHGMFYNVFFWLVLRLCKQPQLLLRLIQEGIVSNQLLSMRFNKKCGSPDCVKERKL